MSGDPEWYIHGLEVQEEGLEGWSVHHCCGDEVTHFVGFFAHKEDAEALLTLRDSDDPEVSRYRETDISPAILTQHGLVTANDCEITTHLQLRVHIAKAVGAIS